MDKDFGICGRDKEINEVSDFINDHFETKKSGILLLTGPPGTGKTLSAKFVLSNIKTATPKLYMNCLQVKTSKFALTKIWDALEMGNVGRKNESCIIAELAKKFSGPKCKPFLLVLDEVDGLPKSKHSNLFSTIFSWTKLEGSKLVILGIANTLDLTTRSQTAVKILGKGFSHVHKIIFRPYPAKTILSILEWHLKNDQNFEGAIVDPKAVDMISKKVARDKGDIRAALDHLRNAIDDVVAAEKKKEKERVRLLEFYPTPPSSPPQSSPSQHSSPTKTCQTPTPGPCREQTNFASLANSVKKRQRQSFYAGDNAMSQHEIVLICLHKLCSGCKDRGIDKREFYGKVSDVLRKFDHNSSSLNIDAALDYMRLQGLVEFCAKRRAGMPSQKIMLIASESQVSERCPNMELISKHIASNLQ